MSRAEPSDESRHDGAGPPPKPLPSRGAFGPGLITGASDDDPSGIGTYSQAGAQFGFGLSWTMLIAFPLMAGIQDISARVGRVTGHGIAGNISRHYASPVLAVLVVLLFAANVINIGADLAAMADATTALIGGPALVYVALFGLGSAVAEIFITYERYVRVLKWLTLSLFSYVATLAVIEVPWGEALAGLVVPRVQLSFDFFMMLVALFGTTISPYLLFWQASEEAEDQRVDSRKKPLARQPGEATAEFRRIDTDTIVGMALSNVIAIAIIITTAATLNRAGITTVTTSAEAASALRPIVGPFASLVFAAGIVGTGLLAIPVLAGSAAYAVGEAFRWRVGLGRKPRQAAAFYGVILLAVALGIALNFTPINPMTALYWSAVVNGVIAVPAMIFLMLIARRPDVMGAFAVTGPLLWLGWLATAAMALCVGGMAAAALT